MSEPISALNATEVENTEPSGIIETEPVATEGLPSEQIEEQTQYKLDGFSEEYVKDGKLFGKWENPNDMAESYKKLQDEKAQSGREAKDIEVKAESEAAKGQAEKDVINRLAENGFNPTDEDFEAWEATGQSREALELKAMKLEKSTAKIHDMVGGKEKAVEIAEWAKSNLSESQLSAFNSEMGDKSGVDLTSAGEFAIRGMLSMFNEANGSNASAQQGSRIQGNPNNTRQSGYQSKSEVTADLNYLMKNPRDLGAQAKYEAKMKISDKSLLR